MLILDDLALFMTQLSAVFFHIDEGHKEQKLRELRQSGSMTEEEIRKLRRSWLRKHCRYTIPKKDDLRQRIVMLKERFQRQQTGSCEKLLRPKAVEVMETIALHAGKGCISDHPLSPEDIYFERPDGTLGNRRGTNKLENYHKDVVECVLSGTVVGLELGDIKTMLFNAKHNLACYVRSGELEDYHIFDLRPLFRAKRRARDALGQDILERLKIEGQDFLRTCDRQFGMDGVVSTFFQEIRNSIEESRSSRGDGGNDDAPLDFESAKDVEAYEAANDIGLQQRIEAEQARVNSNPDVDLPNFLDYGIPVSIQTDLSTSEATQAPTQPAATPPRPTPPPPQPTSAAATATTDASRQGRSRQRLQVPRLVKPVEGEIEEALFEELLVEYGTDWRKMAAAWNERAKVNHAISIKDRHSLEAHSKKVISCYIRDQVEKLNLLLACSKEREGPSLRSDSSPCPIPTNASGESDDCCC